MCGRFLNEASNEELGGLFDTVIIGDPLPLPSGGPFEADALDQRYGQTRVTWTGRALLAAHLAGYDEVGRALMVSLMHSARTLQEMKHNSHLYEVSDVEPHLQHVEELLSMLAWRL